MEKKSKHLNIETVTPVSVGTGEIWSPVTDFFVKNKRLFRIDAGKFHELLMAKDKVAFFSEYVYKSVNESGTGTTTDLRSFIENVLGAAPEKLTRKSIPFPNAGHSKEQVACCYTSNGRPVIPGSSLKGAAKTALFYHWLKNSDEGKEALKTMINHLIPRYDKNWFKDVYPKEVEKKFPDKTDENGKPIFAGLSIGDTEPFPAESLSVYKTERIHLTSPKRKNVPQVKICINKGFFSNLSFKSSQWPVNESFVKQMNHFAHNAILTEQEILNEQSKDISPAISGKLNAFYDRITDQIDRIEDSRELTFFMRVGSGKSFFDNTMAMVLYEADENKDAFKAFCRMYELGKAPNERHYKLKEPFPITRSVISDIYEPMGWVKIRLI